jgi:hypothetical protein
LIQSRASDSAYGSFDNTSQQLHIALYADRRRFIGISTALFNLPLNQDEARAQTGMLGWTLFTEENISYNWAAWCGSNSDLRIGGLEFKHYLSHLIPSNADEDDYRTAYRSWTHTAIAGSRRLMTTSAGRFGWVPGAREVEANGKAP